MFELVFKDLANYNKISNEKLNNYLKNISNDQWNKIFDGYYKSIHDLCSHNLFTDHYMLKIFKLSRNFESLNNKLLENEINFDNINEYIEIRKELDELIIGFVNELNVSDWERILKLSDDMEFMLGSTIISMFNHEVHTRGMISIYLEFLGIENEF
jgi:uncharacterized damage-inducible protein DinB